MVLVHDFHRSPVVWFCCPFSGCRSVNPMPRDELESRLRKRDWAFINNQSGSGAFAEWFKQSVNCDLSFRKSFQGDVQLSRTVRHLQTE